MRKLFLFMMVSVDGFFEGLNHQLDWHNTDAEFADFAIQQLDQVDVIIFGRRTYEMMAAFWPAEHARQVDPLTAERMNTLPKIVFSRTLEKATWSNTRLYGDGVAEVLNDLKSQAGKDLAVFGSSNLCLTLLKLGLLDELRIMVNPVVLGQGNTLFDGLKETQRLSLNSTRTFESGNVLMTYRVRQD